MKTYINLIFVLFLCCGEPHEREFKDYKIKHFSEKEIPPPTLLKGKKLHYTQFLIPRHIIALEDHLIVAENQLNDIFYIYDLNSMEFVKSIGKNGLGPGEITLCASLAKGATYGEFWAFDTNLKAYFGYNINSDHKLAEKEIKQGEALAMAVNMVHSSDSTFMTKLMHGNKMFVELTFDGDTVNTYGTWDRLFYDKRRLPDHVIINVLQGKLAASEDRNYFAFSGLFKDYIEILDKGSGVITSIRGPVNKLPKFDIDSGPGYEVPVFKEPKYHRYTVLHLGESSIFALYIGLTPEEIVEGKKGVSIFEFDYSGQILNNYKIDFH
ncbi:BF3164 family lipoprotein, partial [Aquiflexum sp.]|uniref:BF3164 family lipoprotein n=1 Tax=Aquiflexum sp. TaxID=1872584 RepID=UPI0035940AF6